MAPGSSTPWPGETESVIGGHLRSMGSVYRDTMSRYNIACSSPADAYPDMIPRLWHHTIQAHRREVRDAILETAAALVAQHGLRAVTMSQIAEETGIGRATLYKYFSG